MGAWAARWSAWLLPELELVGGVDINAAGKSLPDGKPVFTNIGEALEAVKADVVVDFTRPDVVMDSLRIILKKGVRAVVGTTGFTDERLAEVKELAEANNTAALIVPNFAFCVRRSGHDQTGHGSSKIF